MHPPVKNPPHNERKLKKTPSRSDSEKKPRPFREKPRPTQANPHLTQTPTPREGGGGGHASEPEKTSPQRKEPENDPDTIPFIPKGALIHAQKPL